MIKFITTVILKIFMFSHLIMNNIKINYFTKIWTNASIQEYVPHNEVYKFCFADTEVGE